MIPLKQEKVNWKYPGFTKKTKPWATVAYGAINKEGIRIVGFDPACSEHAAL